jgi:hypothetical protein
LSGREAAGWSNIQLPRFIFQGFIGIARPARPAAIGSRFRADFSEKFTYPA